MRFFVMLTWHDLPVHVFVKISFIHSSDLSFSYLQTRIP